MLTEIETGRQQLWATWERPVDVEEWEIDEAEVTAAWEQINETFDLYWNYGDPAHWTETYGSWSVRWPDRFVEWWTHRVTAMAFAVRDYREAQQSGALTHVARKGNETDAAFDKHIAGAGRRPVNVFDDDPENPGQKLFILQKIHPDRKFDNAMAGVLSWQARLDAIKSKARPRQHVIYSPSRIRLR